MARPGPIDKAHGSLWRNIPGYLMPVLHWSGISFEEVRPSGGEFALGIRSLRFGAGVVLGEQALQDLAAGGGANGVADAVVLGEEGVPTIVGS